MIIFLLVANLLDAILTNIGIHYSFIAESNPLMKYVYEQSILLFYAIKIVLPLLLILLVTSKFVSKNEKVLNVLLTSAVIVYISILSLHGIWIFGREVA